MLSIGFVLLVAQGYRHKQAQKKQPEIPTDGIHEDFSRELTPMADEDEQHPKFREAIPS